MSADDQREQRWHDHNNLVLLTRYMADAEYTADQIAYAVEKPQKHEDVWRRARRHLRAVTT